MDISVVIPSYNAIGTIDACLGALLRQGTSYDYEVIVVDSSQDGTVDHVSEKFPECRIMRLPRQTYPGEARNVGIRSSKGRIIAFTDTDCIVDDSWIQSIVEIHRLNPAYAVIGGAVWNGTGKNPVGMAEYLIEFNEFTPFRKEGDARFLPTCNLTARREVFDTYGYFRNVIKGSDTLFGKTLRERGERILFTPRLRVIHCNRTIRSAFLKNQRDLGFGSARIRLELNMTGSFLTEMRFLIPLIPFLRFVSIGSRLLRERSPFLRDFLQKMPLVWAGLLTYTIGFYEGSSRQPRDQAPDAPRTVCLTSRRSSFHSRKTP